MTLMNCPSCGKEISDRAVQCPNCGQLISHETHEVVNEQKADDTQAEPKTEIPTHMQDAYTQNTYTHDMYTQNTQTESYNEPPQKQSAGLSIASMVIGIIALICICFPYVGIVFAIIGLVLGIIVLVKHKPGKGFAIAGVVMSALSLIVCILALIGVASLNSSINGNPLYSNLQEDTPVEEITEEPTEEVTEEATKEDNKESSEETTKETGAEETTELGKRSNPVPLGETITFSTNYYTDAEDKIPASVSMVLSNVIRGDDAYNFLMEANQFNEAAPEGYEWIIFDVSLKLDEGSVDDPYRVSNTFNVIDSSGSEVTQSGYASFANGEEFGWVDIYEGGKATGKTAVIAPVGDTSLVEFSDWNTNIFFALE